MKITRLHRAVAEALVREQATPAEIRQRFHISPATLARWEGEPAFQALVGEVEERSRRRARWLFVTFAELAAARLVKLTEAENAETARKACLDVLTRAELTPSRETPREEQAAEPPLIDSETRRRIYELLADAARRGADDTPPEDAQQPKETKPAKEPTGEGKSPRETSAPRKAGAGAPTASRPVLPAVGQMILPFAR